MGSTWCWRIEVKFFRDKGYISFLLGGASLKEIFCFWRVDGYLSGSLGILVFWIIVMLFLENIRVFGLGIYIWLDGINFFIFKGFFFVI